ncbi:hypothetical protein [Pantoea piersonii]|jgi:hypothetical protein|uniref:hypothetical protein n=1 Tax=Pantoea piersonii TaxID=2364647 RepID=UPI000EA38027|nr:hypothetical protein [Pantoea piersonii]MBZ6386810.1 hypothetical protein [Pantoea piersonii]MBZ6400041.1 hypothetical protein [Pantoea piersonii]MBZ6409095.1 hypothetical protein [Pantoea piersonii]MBZ6426092.1 hypothetical protein [Pantoea piersonii]NYB04683.1 hypothetical protein [Pantoea piersonii]
MAKGDLNDFYERLKALLPSGWFADNSPVMHGVLMAGARSLSWCYALYRYALTQTRLSSAADGWLDIAAYDFFGTGLQRRAGMSDDAFRNHIRINLFRERGTRQAVIDILQELTGNTPRVFEPQRPMDTGSYGGPALGYGMAGGYGSLLLPYQAFVVAFRPKGTGIPLIAGYATPPSGYSVPSQGEYVSHEMVNGNVTDAQIYAAVAAVKMEGTIVWIKLL